MFQTSSTMRSIVVVAAAAIVVIVGLFLVSRSRSFRIYAATHLPMLASSVFHASNAELLSDVPDALKYLHHGTLPVPDSSMPQAAAQKGLGVCMPVVAPGDTPRDEFGEGCSYWAQIMRPLA